jgi:hypothetical protein
MSKGGALTEVLVLVRTPDSVNISSAVPALSVELHATQHCSAPLRVSFFLLYEGQN